MMNHTAELVRLDMGLGFFSGSTLSPSRYGPAAILHGEYYTNIMPMGLGGALC